MGGVNLIRTVEGWELGQVETETSLIGRSAWLWTLDTPNAMVGLCFAAFRRAVMERRRRQQSLSDGVTTLTGEIPAMRHGSTVRSGVDVLSYLAQKWGRH